MFFRKQKFDVKQLKVNKFIFDVKQLKMNRLVEFISNLISSTLNATGTFATLLSPVSTPVKYLLLLLLLLFFCDLAFFFSDSLLGLIAIGRKLIFFLFCCHFFVTSCVHLISNLFTLNRETY